MSHNTDVLEYLKFRLGIVGLIGLLTGIGVLGLIKLINTASLGALPLYVHVLAGAAVLPVVVFFLEYSGMNPWHALGWGVSAAVVSMFFMVLISEGAANIAQGGLDLGIGALFYAFSIGLVAGTVFVLWLQRVSEQRLEPIAPPRRGVDGD